MDTTFIAIVTFAFLALLASIRMILSDIHKAVAYQGQQTHRVASALERIADRDKVKIDMDPKIAGTLGEHFAGGIEGIAYSIGQQMQRGWIVG